MLPLAFVSVMWTGVSLVVGDTANSLVVYGVVSGIFFLVFMGVAYIAFGRDAAIEAQDTSLASDPIVTGERKGLISASCRYSGVV